MMIIDSHVHIFKKISGVFEGAPLTSMEYGKAKKGNQQFQLLPPSFEACNSTIETLINHLDWCGVDKAVLMPNVFYGYHNEYVHEATEKYPDRFKAVALVDITKGKTAASELYDLIKNKGFYGLKIDTGTALQFMPELMLDDEILEPIFACCNEFSLPVMFHLSRESDLDSLKKISDNFNKIKYIICHFGSESVISDYLKIDERLNLLFNLVLNKSNIWIETSSIHHHIYTKEEYPFTSSRKLIEKAYAVLGPDKIIWGSDYPAILTTATYKQLINYTINGCKKIPEYDMEMIMGKNALNIFWS